MKKILLSLILFSYLFNSLAQEKILSVDTLSLYYDINSYDLNATQRQQIDSFSSQLRDSINLIEIFAYCDYLGSKAYNLKLAKQRAEQVKSKIGGQRLDSGLEVHPIGQLLEKHPNEIIGNSKNRRVDIIISYYTIIENQNVENEISDKLKEFSVGDLFVIQDLNFIGGRHFLTEESEPNLEKLFIALEENPSVHIEIQGHICCQDKGDGEDLSTGLQNLSVARAEYVYNSLIEMGIDAERLSYKGLGSSRKLYPDEKSGFEQQQNRRVEIFITQK